MGKLAAFASKLKGKYGDRAVGRADIVGRPDRRVETGSLELNYAMGGGLAIGWIHLYYGDKSSGKTTTSKRQVAICQKLCRNCFRPAKNIEAIPPTAEELAEDDEARWSAKGECDCYSQKLYEPEEPTIPELMGLGYIKGDKKPAKNSKAHKAAVTAWHDTLTANSYEEYVCCWIDTENAFDRPWAAQLGVDLRRLLLIRPESAEEAVDIWCSLILTVQADLLVIDSIAQLAPKKEITASMEDWQQGLQARIVNKAIRKAVSGSSAVANQRRTVTQIWINQTRMKIGVLFGDPTVKPAGKGQDFATHVELKFWHGKKKVIDDVYGDEKKGEALTIPLEEQICWQVMKNRSAGTLGVRGMYWQSMRDNDVRPAGSVIEDETIFKMAMHYLVKQNKSKKSAPTTYSLAGQDFTSQKALAVELRENPDMKVAVRAALLDTMLTTRGSA